MKQNLKAIESDTLMNVVDAKVVDLSIEGIIHNAPEEVDEEFEALRAKDIAEAEFSDLTNEALELEKALDLAFEQLTHSPIEDEMNFDFQNEIEDLDLSIDETITRGREFGLDLTFLNEVSSQNSNIGDERDL